MRLLITIPSLAGKHGGPSLSALRTAQYSAALGASVGIAYGESPTTPPMAQGQDVRHLPIHTRDGRFFPQYPGYQRALSRHAAAFAPDIVYDFGVWQLQNVASFAAARSRARPWLCSPRGMLEPWPMSDKKLRKQIAWNTYQGPMLRHAAAMVATSAEESLNLRALLPQAQIWLVPNGVDLPEQPAPRAPAEQRQALFLSRLHPKKQPELLIRLWARLRPENWRLVIAGPGPADYRRALQSLIEQLKVADLVELRDGVYGEEKIRLMRESALFVLPTLSENFGIAIAEALAYDLPVITTTETPWQEVTAAGCGWIVPPGETEFGAALQQALALAPQALRDMGLRGRALAEKYSWRRSAELLLQGCSGLLASKP